MLNRMMCRAASEIIVVTDSSKFERICLHKILEPQGISKLVTDTGIPGRGPRSADADRRRGHHRVKAIREIIAQHKAGRAVGIYSACSAHPLVIEAALAQARRESGSVLIEATSNQVNQDGGYTGMRPADFSRFVLEIAARLDVPREQVLLGGDHLGPNCWQDLPAEDGDGEVRAAHRRLCRRGLSQDSSGLLDVLRGRSDRAHRRGRGRAQRRGFAPSPSEPGSAPAEKPPVYVVGTEVPVPGGAQEALTELALTEPDGRHRDHRCPLARPSVARDCTTSGRA